jgi:hypothetical protein
MDTLDEKKIAAKSDDVDLLPADNPEGAAALDALFAGVAENPPDPDAPELSDQEREEAELEKAAEPCNGGGNRRAPGALHGV